MDYPPIGTSASKGLLAFLIAVLMTISHFSTIRNRCLPNALVSKWTVIYQEPRDPIVQLIAGKKMLEQNLVSRFHTRLNLFLLGVALLAVGSFQMGCSRLGQSSFDRGLFPLPTRSKYTDQDEVRSKTPHDASPEVGLSRQDEPIHSDEAIPEEVQTPAPSISGASIASAAPGQSASPTDPPCSHLGGCDCCQDKAKFEMPHLEPTEPPNDARLAPPKGILNQPLLPIDSVQTSSQVEVSDDRVANPSQSRQGIETTFEKVVTIDNKSAILSPVAHPSRDIARPAGRSQLTPMVVESPSLIDTTVGSRSQYEGGFEYPSSNQPLCSACQSLNCNGGCRVDSRRAGLNNSVPVITSNGESNPARLQIAEIKVAEIQKPEIQNSENAVIVPRTETNSPSAVAEASLAVPSEPRRSAESFDDLQNAAWQLMVDQTQSPGEFVPDPVPVEPSAGKGGTVSTVSHHEDIFSSQRSDAGLPLTDQSENLIPDATGVASPKVSPPVLAVPPVDDGFISPDDSPEIKKVPDSSANLELSNAVFCTEVSGFSQFKPFASTIFRSGQRVLVYCEVENQHSESQGSAGNAQFTTRLQGNYVIYDSQGNVLEQIRYPVVEDVAGKRRRDFYMYFPIELGEFAPGEYWMELMIEDLGNGQSSSIKTGLEFQIE